MKVPRFSTKSLLLLTAVVCWLLYLAIYKQYEFPVELATSPNRMAVESGEVAELAAGMKVSFDVASDVTAEFEGLRIDPAAKPGEHVVLGIVRASGSAWQTLPDAIRHRDRRLPVSEQAFVQPLQQAIDKRLGATGTQVLQLHGLEFADSNQ